MTERTFERVFEFGIETLREPRPDADFVPAHSEPVAVQVAVEASLPRPSGYGRDFFYLTPMAERNRREGKPYVWMRDVLPRDNPDLLPRMRAISGEATLPFPLETYLNRPWAFSADLFKAAPEQSLSALREFGLLRFVTDMAPHYDDREFPIAWMKEAASFLNHSGELDAAIQSLRGFLFKREKALELWQTNEEGEMMLSYARDRIRFDQRVIALFEAERGNYSAVEPLLAGWDPDAASLNASGLGINILREVARAQWKLGRTAAAIRSTRTWIKAYSRDLANDLLHPEYTSAAERFTEFDSDFEAIGGYFDLLEAVTDPQVAADIVVGLKGLCLAVASATQVRRENFSDPEQKRLSEELFRPEEESRQDNLSGKPVNHQTRDRLFQIWAALSSRRLSGVDVDLADHADWSALSAEIARRAAAGTPEWELEELETRRDLLAMDHLIETGGFLVKPADLAAAPAPGERLVDFFRIPPAPGGIAGSYGAIILRKGAAPALVPLGNTALIDAVVKRYRDLMTGQGDFALNSLEDLNSATEAIVRETYSAGLAPLREHLGDDLRVIFCPEGQLSFLPFGLLGESSDTLAQASLEISYVNALRDLLKSTRPRDATAPRTAVLLGNPTFELSAAGTTESASAAPDKAINETARALPSEASRGVEFVPLPGTEKEIQMLAPRLGSAGYEVVSLAAGEATEDNLVSRIQSPTILHFATHGFFLNRLPVANQGATGANRSAMLLSGLALTGAQSALEAWNRGQIPEPGNDGILFASEVSRLDLSGPEMVVLSACETAVGVRTGDKGYSLTGDIGNSYGGGTCPGKLRPKWNRDNNLRSLRRPGSSQLRS